MCGIAGVARVDGGVLDARADQLLKRLADLLSHRGPDDRELLRDGPVGLAFTRLSLVDPEGGGQPLVSDDGSLVLIVNGEIYNHRELAAALPPGTRLRTGSDCEVLLYLYRHHGLRFLDKVRGMFGLILWDRRQGELILARDRFGIKPLYYHRTRERIVLASEIKALFADPATPRRLDWETALATPLLASAPFATDMPTTTWFEGVESVRPGTIVRIDLADGTTREHRYWKFPGAPEHVPESADEFVETYRRLFIDSVSECASADAELGLFLSGGIDSAAVAAVAAERTNPLHTFTVLSASTYRVRDAEFGHRVAAKLGLPNHQVLFDDARTPDPDEWKRLLWLLETPFCGPEIYYKHELHRYAKAVRPELRGMLLGAASDEFNGGYSVDLAGGGDWLDFDHHIRGIARTGALLHRPELAPWWAYDERPPLTDEVVRRYAAGEMLDDAYGTYLAWQYRKIEQYNVWHEDRTAAGSGIEARVPFLDHRLVELVAAVPPRLRQQLLWDKQILRRGMRGVVPDEVVERAKAPFFHGDNGRHTYRMLLRMLSEHGGALVEEAVAAPGGDTFIDAQALRQRLRAAADDPGGAQVEIALRVVNLGLLAGMVADLPAPTVTTPIGPPPPAVRVSDWDAQQPELERLIGLRPTVDPSCIPVLRDGVMLLTQPGMPDECFVAVDGTIEYVLDDDEPDYREFLMRLDGSSSLQRILDDLDRTLENLYPALADLVERRVVELIGPLK